MRESNHTPPKADRIDAVRRREQHRCQGCKRTDTEVQNLDVRQLVPDDFAANYRSNYVLLCDRCHRRSQGDHRPEEVNDRYGR